MAAKIANDEGTTEKLHWCHCNNCVQIGACEIALEPIAAVHVFNMRSALDRIVARTFVFGVASICVYDVRESAC